MTQTRERLVAPHGRWAAPAQLLVTLCFWDSGNGCAAPGSDELLTELPARLDISQFLRFGAVNALMGGPRVYIPWDLDTSMKDSASVYAGGVAPATAAASMACCSRTGAMTTPPSSTSCSITA